MSVRSKIEGRYLKKRLPTYETDEIQVREKLNLQTIAKHECAENFATILDFAVDNIIT